MHKAFPLLEESSHWQYNFPLPVEGVPTARRMKIPLLKSLHCYDEETASQRELAAHVGNKMHKAFPLPVIEFPLSEEVPTASKECSYCQKKRDATAEKITLLLKSISNCQSKSYDSYAKFGGITQAYQSFKDMLKDFDREDLDDLWRLVKERFSTIVPTVDKDKALWLYSNCGVYQVSSTTRRPDMYMLVEKDYPLSDGVMILMLSRRQQVEKDSEMARDLVMKIFMKANQPKSRSLDTSSK
uniref:Uncharacterized protein n=1 Tax=Tanacetum cinerariifolium TaxID=118510 RepID=A0A6L2K252_TANCI|nr:hypothetical protein [Tanacetum cinerariifolium]